MGKLGTESRSPDSQTFALTTDPSSLSKDHRISEEESLSDAFPTYMTQKDSGLTDSGAR